MKKKIGNNGQSPTTSEEVKDEEYYIPLDLIIEILFKLPAKSLGRFLCVSKLFASIIHRQDFINSFLTQSSTRPSLLFTLASENGLSFLSSSPYDNALTFLHRIECLSPHWGFTSHSVGGLVLCRMHPRFLICNPTTRQFIALPEVRYQNQRILYSSFFGYDPVGYQYKVLCSTGLENPVAAWEHHVLTLGAQLSWRTVESSALQLPSTEGLCINGVLYYGAFTGSKLEEYVLVSFDVRSEKFDFIRYADDMEKSRICFLTLINYMGKVTVTDEGPAGSYYLWILEDAKKHEWSKIHISYEYFRTRHLCIVGTTHTGEIIFAPYGFSDPFYVTYYNVKSNSVRVIHIEGIKDHRCRIFISSDHAENIMRL